MIRQERQGISIHALLAESDNRYGRPIDVQLVFLSTLSLRRATLTSVVSSAGTMDFYPRSPCGERRTRRASRQQPAGISIHALLAESDAKAKANEDRYKKFLSTLSLRRATSQQPAGTTSTTYFYPRSPCGERLPYQRQINQKSNFYPRSPCGERHHPQTSNHPHNTNFYPRSPCGERLVHALKLARPMLFLSTLSLRRATTVSTPDRPEEQFLSTLSLRRATREESGQQHSPHNFYPRSPCGERPQDQYRQ